MPVLEPLDNLKDIQAVAARLLRAAAAEERLPTPVDDIVAAAGLIESDDYVLSESKISKAPRELRRILRAAGRKIRGALDRRERVLHVNPAIELPAQRQFIRCHETMHDALPWQRDLLVLGDTAKTLAPDIELRFERDANQGAAELLFQVDYLRRIARDYPVDIATPVILHKMFGASIHATFRRWVEDHSGVLCGVVLGADPIASNPVTFERFVVVRSAGWADAFGRTRFPRRMSSSTHPFLATIGEPLRADIDASWGISDVDGVMKTVRVQSFNNTYRTFVLIWLPGKESFIARHRGQQRIAVAR